MQLRRAIELSIGGVWGDEPDGSNDICVARVADFDMATLTVVDTPTRRSVPPKQHAKRALRRGDLLLEKSGGGEKQNVGRVVEWRGASPAVTSNFINLLRPAAWCAPRYLVYFNRALYLSGWANACTKQTTGIQNLDVATYLTASMPEWSRSRQEAVARFLDEESERIEEAMKAAHALDARTAALEREALIAAMRPLPESKLAYRFEVQLGKMLDEAKHAPADERSFYLRNVNVQWGHIDTRDLKRMPFSRAERKKFTLVPGDLLVCEGGEVGRAAVWRGEVAGCYYQKALHRVRARADDSTEFLQWSLRYIALTRGFSADSTGSAIPHLPADRLRELRIPTTSRERQEQVVAKMGQLSRSLTLSRGSRVALCNTLADYRDSLITEVVTGKLDVSRVSDTEMEERLHAAAEDRLDEVVA